MKTKKRFISAFTAVIMTVFCVLFNVGNIFEYTDAEAALAYIPIYRPTGNLEKIGVTSAKGMPGDTVRIYTTVTAEDNMESLDVAIGWRDAALKCTGVESVDAFGARVMSTVYEGFVCICAYSTLALADGHLAALDFKIPEDAAPGTVYDINYVRLDTVATTTADITDRVGVSGGKITVLSENEISESQLNMKVGDTKLLKVSNYGGTITWVSDDTNVVTVKNGLVTAVGNGSACVYAVVGTKLLICNINVTGGGQVTTSVTSNTGTTTQTTVKMTQTTAASPSTGKTTSLTSDITAATLTNPSGTGVTDISGTGVSGTGVTDISGTGVSGTGVTDISGTGISGTGVTDISGTGVSGTGVTDISGTGVSTITTEFTGLYEPQGVLSIRNFPEKALYRTGEPLDLSGLRVNLDYYYGKSGHRTIYENVSPVENSDAFIVDTSDFDSTKAGTYTIRIRCTDDVAQAYWVLNNEASFDVIVRDPVTTTVTTDITGTDTTAQTTVTTTGVKADKPRITMFVGDKLHLGVKDYKGEVSWATADSGIAAIDDKGYIVGKKKGETICLAIYENKYAFCIIEVKDRMDSSGVLGDADGNKKLDVRDAAMIAQYVAAGKASRLPECADYNGDGVVNVRDAAAIARRLSQRFNLVINITINT